MLIVFFVIKVYKNGPHIILRFFEPNPALTEHCRGIHMDVNSSPAIDVHIIASRQLPLKVR